jgi:hypothetical protein
MIQYVLKYHALVMGNTAVEQVDEYDDYYTVIYHRIEFTFGKPYEGKLSYNLSYPKKTIELYKKLCRVKKLERICNA